MSFLQWVGGILSGIALAFGTAGWRASSGLLRPRLSTLLRPRKTLRRKRRRRTPQLPQANGWDTAQPLPPCAPTLAHADALNVHALPLGDGKVSTAPKVGYVYSCQQSFSAAKAGAEHAGGWIQGSTWDLTEKIAVQGSYRGPTATFSDTVQNAVRILTGNGLPVDAHDRHLPHTAQRPGVPVRPQPQQHQAYSASATRCRPTRRLPQRAICVPMGAVGYALNGVAIYNALDADGRDAVAHEVQDSCDGHPQGAGQYHYHGPSPCMPNVRRNNTVVGYALDGFPITSCYDAKAASIPTPTSTRATAPRALYRRTWRDAKGYHYVLTESTRTRSAASAARRRARAGRRHARCRRQTTTPPLL